jgi:hypothetical protein
MMNPLKQCTLALLLAGGLATAQTAPEQSLPAAQTFGQVSVISGGVDLDQAELFKQHSARFPLRVVFSVKSGDYAVPAEFTILRQGQAVATLSSAGPWLLIDLPAGTYTLQARFDDQSVQQRTVTVGRAGQTVHWVAPGSVG